MSLLSLRRGSFFGCGLLAMLLLAQLLDRSQPEKALPSEGWTLTDFLEHLDQHGVRLQAIWGARGRGGWEHVYLTTDPDATYRTMQRKLLMVERIDEWHGTVWVGHVLRGSGSDDDLARWGENGCRVGPFILFGDDQLLRQIQDVCPSQGGR
jgi:hypothetical protein